MIDKKQVKKYRHKIVEFYAAVGVPMKLTFARAAGDLFIFEIKFVPGTTEDKIKQYLRDAQQVLKLQLFQLHREDTEFFFVASEHKTFDNRLLGILTSPAYADYTKNMAVPCTLRKTDADFSSF